MPNNKGTLIFDVEKGHIYIKFATGKIRGPIGRPNEWGHIQIVRENRMCMVHRLLWEYNFGEIPKKMQIDHINGIPSDNRIVNLRMVHQNENSQNQHRAHRDGTSGHKGVSFHANTGKWQATVTHRGKAFYLGIYQEIDDAVLAYAEAAARLHTHNPHAKTAI